MSMLSQPWIVLLTPLQLPLPPLVHVPVPRNVTRPNPHVKMVGGTPSLITMAIAHHNVHVPPVGTSLMLAKAVWHVQMGTVSPMLAVAVAKPAPKALLMPPVAIPNAQIVKFQFH